MRNDDRPDPVIAVVHVSSILLDLVEILIAIGPGLIATLIIGLILSGMSCVTSELLRPKVELI